MHAAETGSCERRRLAGSRPCGFSWWWGKKAPRSAAWWWCRRRWVVALAATQPTTLLRLRTAAPLLPHHVLCPAARRSATTTTAHQFLDGCVSRSVEPCCERTNAGGRSGERFVEHQAKKWIAVVLKRCALRTVSAYPCTTADIHYHGSGARNARPRPLRLSSR